MKKMNFVIFQPDFETVEAVSIVSNEVSKADGDVFEFASEEEAKHFIRIFHAARPEVMLTGPETHGACVDR